MCMEKSVMNEKDKMRKESYYRNIIKNTQTKCETHIRKYSC